MKQHIGKQLDPCKAWCGRIVIVCDVLAFVFPVSLTWNACSRSDKRFNWPFRENVFGMCKACYRNLCAGARNA